MNNYLTVLKAMFKNKLRFGAGKSKRSVIALVALLAFAYVMIMAILLTNIIRLKQILVIPQITSMLYFVMLITAAVVVMIFGIINLVTTLYLSKDTDFYSMLPIKPTVVFAAKLSYVYISEMVIAAAIMLPLTIAFGIVAETWAWFFVISVLMIAIIPALPLMVAALFAIPVMYLASMLKNRGIVTLIFSIVLFGGLITLYMYFIISVTSLNPHVINNMLNGLNVVLDILYPYTALANAACGIPVYGLNLGASTAVNLAIFIGISVALLAILLIASRFMYAQSAKANNQTDNSKAKKGEFKSSSSLKAIVKREYQSALRTTQVTFQCYCAIILPIIMTVIICVIFNSLTKSMSIIDLEGNVGDFAYFTLVPFCMLAAILPVVGQGAMTTFSREGSALSSLKILPIDVKQLLKGKLTAWLALAVPVALISVIIANAFNFRTDLFLLSLFSLVPLAAEFVVFGALWDLKSPKLKWTDPSQAIKHNGHATIGQLLMMVGGLVALFIMMGLTNSGASMPVILAVCWSIIYAILVIFGIADIYLYRNVNAYYNRLEI